MRVKVGDYVRVRDGVHDESMDSDRRGLVVEMVPQHGWETTNKLGLPDQALVMFKNGAFLKFHETQLEVLGDFTHKMLNE